MNSLQLNVAKYNEVVLELILVYKTTVLISVTNTPAKNFLSEAVMKAWGKCSFCFSHSSINSFSTRGV